MTIVLNMTLIRFLSVAGDERNAGLFMRSLVKLRRHLMRNAGFCDLAHIAAAAPRPGPHGGRIGGRRLREIRENSRGHGSAALREILSIREERQ